MSRDGRIYISCITPDWLNQNPDLQKSFGQFSSTAAMMALGQKPTDPISVKYDSERASYFVNEEYMAARPDVDVLAAVKPFKSAETQTAIEACRPVGWMPRRRDPATTVSENDEVVIHVPRYEVKDGQVVLDGKGVPVDFAKGFTRKTREEWGAVVEFKPYVYDQATGIMGAWTARASEVARHDKYRQFIDGFLTPEAAAKTKACYEHDLHGPHKAGKDRPDFIEIGLQDVSTAQARDKLAVDLKKLKDPDDFVRYHYALAAVQKGFGDLRENLEGVMVRFTDQVSARDPSRSRLVDNTPSFSPAERAEIKEKRIKIGLDEPVPMPRDDMSQEAKNSRNPNMQGAIRAERDVGRALALVKSTYEEMAFPIPTLDEAITDFDRRKATQAAGRGGASRGAEVGGQDAMRALA
jgi:hypothetical protein